MMRRDRSVFLRLGGSWRGFGVIMVAGIAVFLFSENTLPGLSAARRPGVMLNLTVDDPGDATDANPGDGICQTAGGVCTLRAAIEESVASPGAHSIAININGVIDLNGPLPNIDNSNGLTSLQLTGNGANQLTIRRAAGGNYQVFNISPAFPGAMAVTITGMTISNGVSAVSGGGVYSLYSDLTLDRVVFTGNTAPNGSALYIGGSEATITNCTFSANSGAGAAIAYDTLTPTGFQLQNATITANTGTGVRLGLGAGANGQISSSTISGNTVNGIQLGGAGGRTVGLLGNIIAGNGGSSLALSGTNSYGSQGGNLASDGGGGYLTGTGDLLNTDPQLGSLGNYGGSTPTQPLLRGSPAIDAGVVGAPLADQRGVARVGAPDIGAFESRGFQMVIAGGDNQLALTGGLFANPLSVILTAGDAGVPVTGAPVIFTAPGTGASATITGSPAAVSGATATTGAVTANGLDGSYLVMASTSGVAAVSFSLRNNAPPRVVSIVRTGPSPTVAASLGFTVSFSESVTGLTAGNLTLALTNAPAAAITAITGSGTTWTVSVATGGGTGRIGLDLTAATGVVDGDGAGLATGPLIGEVYLLAPRVLAVTRTTASPTTVGTVGYSIAFSENVTGLGVGNFGLVTTGLTGAAISGVSGSGMSWMVTVSRGTGSGTLGLNLTGAAGVTDSDGVGPGNLPFAGEVYTIAPQVVSIVRTGLSPTGAGSLGFLVTFTESLTGGGAGNFGLSVGGVLGAAITGVTGSGATRTVMAGTGAGSGTVRLDLVNSTGLVSAGGIGLAGLPFAGEAYAVDRTPPVTTINSGPPGMTPIPAATFLFTGSDVSGIAGYECRIAGGPFAACVSPFTLTGLAIGRHQLEVRAIDNLGNVDPVPARYDWIVNNLPVITGAGIDLPAGGSGESRAIAVVSDPDQAAATLTVTAMRLSGTGVSLGGVTIDGAGRVVAIGQAECGAVDSTFRLTVTDALGGVATMILVVTIRPLTAAGWAGGPAGGRAANRPGRGCQAPGPGITPLPSAELSSQKAGSLLVFDLYSSHPDGLRGGAADETRMALTNTSARDSVALHLFLIDGADGKVADAFLRLTAGQTVSLLASELDPGITGYLVVVAVDDHGCPRAFNHLIGDYHVRLTGGYRASGGALAVAAVDASAFGCLAGAVTVELRFDGRRYNQLPRTVAIDSLASLAEGNETLLIVNRLGGDLTVGAAPLGPLTGLLFDDLEQSASFAIPAGRTQSRLGLGRNFPRTAPRYEVMIPAGRTGWMKFAAVADEALSGLVINLSGGRFNQGHPLHHLALTGSATLTMPVLSP